MKNLNVLLSIFQVNFSILEGNVLQLTKAKIYFHGEKCYLTQTVYMQWFPSLSGPQM